MSVPDTVIEADWPTQIAEVLATIVMVGSGLTEIGTVAVLTHVPSDALTVKTVGADGLTMACDWFPPYGVQV